MGGKKYSIGIDFGTQSGRTVLVDVTTGEEVATSVYEYKDGVIDEVLPGTNIELDADFALQNPADYIETVKVTIPAVLEESSVDPEDVVGLGTDFTACTMMPIDREGIPLCMKEEWRDNPHAWVKIWKHHAAQPQANKLNDIARQRGEDFLSRYGGKISSEWLFPKIWQILDEAREIYEAADRFIEGADWIVLQLVGQEKRNLCTAGYKAIWEKSTGYPSDDFFAALDPRLRHLVDDKLSREIYPLGGRAGGLTPEMADWTGLRERTAVSIGNVDAHVSVPACTVTTPGRMVMIMGTSICHMVLGAEKRIVEGMCGVVEDGIIPGYFGFEAGQSCVGDHFAWFVEHATPPEYHEEAGRRGWDLHRLLEEKAAKLKPGESGLLALDWWNGNRSILVDVDLTGMLLGATLATRAEEIYRALIEATAFGTRIIIETFEKSGVAVDELVACGGLPEKNTLLMQIYSDVTGREIKVAASTQTPALGSAMHGAVAAGKGAGGYEGILEAAKQMAHLKDETYRPIPEQQPVYDRLYRQYMHLHDYFGRGENDVMKVLKGIKAEALGKKR